MMLDVASQAEIQRLEARINQLRKQNQLLVRQYDEYQKAGRTVEQYLDEIDERQRMDEKVVSGVTLGVSRFTIAVMNVLRDRILGGENRLQIDQITNYINQARKKQQRLKNEIDDN